MPDAGSDVVVVGAGITGSLASYALARHGIQVTLVERAGVGNQASGHNPGGLNPLHGVGIPGPMASLAMESFRLHLEHWETIARLSGTDFGARRVDRMLLAFEEEDRPELTRSHDLHEAAEGFCARRLEREEARALEPRLGPDVIEAVLTSGNACVDGHRYTVAVAKAAVALGAALLPNDVRGVKSEGSRATSIILDTGELACDALVLATGPWSAEAARWLDVAIPIKPLKGELLVAEAPGAPLERDLTWRGAALYARPNGSMWLGGTKIDAGFDTRPTTEGRASILDGAARIMPAVRDVKVIEQLAGLRPVSPDGLPVVGRASGWQNVYLATGAGQKGMLMSAGMGHAVADLIARGSSDLQIGACSPERFAD